MSTSAGCWARALHRAGGTVRRRWPWASTQRTARSRRPPPQEALHGPKCPAAQLRGQGQSIGPWLREWGERQAVPSSCFASLVWAQPHVLSGTWSLQVPPASPSRCPQAAPEPEDTCMEVLLRGRPTPAPNRDGLFPAAPAGAGHAQVPSTRCFLSLATSPRLPHNLPGRAVLSTWQ